jgi:hypothetical protein
MGIATFPASSSGLSSAIKSLQRGSAASAGNITISAVDTTKTMVNSFSTASAGTVAATGTVSAANGTASGQTTSNSAAYGGLDASGTYMGYAGSTGTPQPYVAPYYSGRYGQTYNPNNVPAAPFGGYMNSGTFGISAMNVNGQNIGLNATNLSGGSTNLMAGVYGAYLSSSTNLVVTGPCQYEVVEYN